MSERLAPEFRFGVVAALAIVYALCYSAIKVGLAYAPPLGFAGIRAAIGAAALFAGMIVLGRPLLPPRALWPLILALALTGTTFAYGAMFMSPLHAGVGIASVLGNTGPLMTVLLGTLFLGEHNTRGKMAALVLGLAGVLAIYNPTTAGPATNHIMGIALPLVAAAGFAVSTVLFKKANTGTAITLVSAWQLLIGSIPLLLLSIRYERATPIEWSTSFVLVLLFLSLIGTALTVSTWYWLIQREDVGRASLILFLVPAVGVGVAYALFREPIALSDVAGVSLILGGLGFLMHESVNPGGGEGPNPEKI